MLPASLAAVSPHSFALSASAPFETSHRHNSRCPLRAASKSGVLPCQCSAITRSSGGSASSCSLYSASVAATLPSAINRRNFAVGSSSSYGCHGHEGGPGGASRSGCSPEKSLPPQRCRVSCASKGNENATKPIKRKRTNWSSEVLRWAPIARTERRARVRDCHASQKDGLPRSRKPQGRGAVRSFAFYSAREEAFNRHYLLTSSQYPAPDEQHRPFFRPHLIACNLSIRYGAQPPIMALVRDRS